MKGIIRVLIPLFGIAILFIFYVQAQISLFQVSYSIAAKSHQLAEKSEEYRHLKFQVDQLKAPRLLEQKIKELHLDLTLPKQVRVIQIPPTPAIQPATNGRVSLRPLSDGLMDILGRWIKVAQAQARTDN